MDDVSGLSNKSNDFGNFLTASRKFGNSLVILFGYILNIFPGSIQLFSISNFLSANCNCEEFNYIAARDLWLNRLYLEISNPKEKVCLTIDCRHLNSSGPAKYRTTAENDIEQLRYFNQRKKEKVFHKYFAKRIRTNNSNVIFQIDSLVDTSKNDEIKIFIAVSELKALTKKKW